MRALVSKSKEGELSPKARARSGQEGRGAEAPGDVEGLGPSLAASEVDSTLKRPEDEWRPGNGYIALIIY